MNTNSLELQKIQFLKKLAAASKWKRFAYNPLRYLYAMVIRHLSYPLFKTGTLKKTTLFFGKEMTVLLPAGTDLYLLGIKTHDSELRLCAYLCNALQKGDVFVDIGAHFGFFSLLAAHLSGTSGRVISFEPSRETLRILNENTQKLPQIKVMQMALGDQVGEIDFYEFPILFSEYNSYQTTQYQGERWFKKLKPKPVKVKLCRLDQLELLPMKVIKIDAEGSEDKVLEGAKGILEEQNPVIVMEYLADETELSSHHIAFQILLKKGYAAHVSDFDGILHPIENVTKYMKENGIDSENIIFTRINA